MTGSVSLRGKRRRRGAAFIWIVVIAFPVFAAAGFIALDATRDIAVHREVQLAAESTAVGAAWQIQNGSLATTSATPGCHDAYCVADETWNLSESQGALAGVSGPDGADAPVMTPIISGGNGTPQTVTISVHYSVGGMLFAGFFGQHSPTYTAHATAYVCNPTSNNIKNPSTLGNNCQRPSIVH